MINRLKPSYRTRRMLVMFLLISIYILGRNIPLPFIQINRTAEQGEALSIFSVALDVSGGDLTQISIFSLGLSPWMSTMILWRFFTMGSRWSEKKFTTRTLDSWRYLLTFIIAIIQSIGVIPLLDLQTDSIKFWGWSVNPLFLIILFMIAGCFYLIWLATMNSKYGIGNMTIFILASMLLKWPQGIYQFLLGDHVILKEYLHIGGTALFGILLLIVILTIVIDKSEYRISIKRILLNNNLSEQSYIPIKLNPAGGMPIMYAMTLMALPRFLLQAFIGLFPDVDLLNQLDEQLSLTNGFGVTLYIATLIFLTIGFSFVNINPDRLAKTLKESSDYIIHVRPGNETQRFLNQKVFRISLIGSLFIAVIAGLPMYLVVYDVRLSSVATIPGMVIIVVSLILTINEEIVGYSIGKHYQSLF